FRRCAVPGRANPERAYSCSGREARENLRAEARRGESEAACKLLVVAPVWEDLRQKDGVGEALMRGNIMRARVRAGKFYGLVVMLGSLLTSAATPQTPANDAFTSARQFADQQGKEWIQRGIPGLSLTVAVDGKIVYSEGFGFADMEERV